MRRLEEGQHECTPINRPGFAEHQAHHGQDILWWVMSGSVARTGYWYFSSSAWKRGQASLGEDHVGTAQRE